ncbi:MAG: hypothetical protein NE327_23020 [Lentisphaeraceae bacterium]|nr:hypothetical protein [Lentisphaeraceae bacterium]
MNFHKTWLTLQRENLERTKIPSDVYESEKRWMYFLEHDYDYESNWSLDRESQEEKLKVLALKKSYLNN